MAEEIQIRRDTAANWTSVNPILAQGEIGLETDTNQLKIGDGVLAWTALAYFGGNPFDQTLNTTDAVIFARVSPVAALVEQEVTAGFSAGTLTIDLNTASVFIHNLTADITTIVINNGPASGKAIGFTLIFTADGTARSVAWGDFRWPNGVAPTLTITAGKEDVFVVFTYGGATGWYAYAAGQNQ